MNERLSLTPPPRSLIIPSLTQLVYLNLNNTLAYLITAQVHLTLATILSCTTVLPPLTDLVVHKHRPWSALEKGNSTSTSTSTLGSTAAYAAPSPHPLLPEYIDTVLVSRVEEAEEEEDGLELVRVRANVHVEGRGFVGKGKGKGPVRPRSPRAHERPDLSVFVRQAVPRAPPAILVRGGRDAVGSRGSGSGAGKRVQFDV